ncbi:unnamed protein product [Effrenium voratum]|nr:unnamed protein product [Effrenium voratum]
MNFGSDSKFMRFRGSCESSRFCEMLGIAHIVRRQVSSFYLPTLSFNLTPSLVSPSHPSDPRLAAVLPSGNRSAMDHEDDDPGLAGLSPEFQAMLGGMAGHSASFAKLMEKRTLSKQEEKAKDDETYLESYAELAIHEEMLKDQPRVEAYRKAIEHYGSEWQSSAVVDVGAGTGLLSVFCARFARRVVAVEASRLSHFLRQVAEKNAPKVVEVHECLAEQLELEEKVDVIVSEWMGYCLLFENMLPSVLSVRDRFLKPGGLMLPSRCRLLMAPVEDPWRQQKMDFWRDVHGVDMSPLAPLAAATFGCQHRLVRPEALTAEAVTVLELDIGTVKSAELDSFQAPLDLCLSGSRLDGFAFWFECEFGAAGWLLSTSPSAPETHWKQTLLYLRQPLEASEVKGEVRFRRHESFTRGYRVTLELKAPGRKLRSEDFELR